MWRSCPICEASCGLVLEVDRSDKKVLSIRGDDEDPRSRGYICPKAFAVRGVYEDPDRIRRPLRRRADGWDEIGWDEALEYAGTRLRGIRERCGQHAVGTYIGNPTGHDLGAMLYTTPFIQVLDTQRLFTGATVDQFPKNLTCRLMYGDAWLFPIPDIDRTDFFLVLGANPLVSNGSLMSAPNMRARIKQLRCRGTKVVVLDPRRSETAAAADEHLFIKPGADAYLLFAMLNVFFAENLIDLGRLRDFTEGVEKVSELARLFTPEIVAGPTGIPAGDTRRLAREFAAAERAICYGRFGTCTQEFGSLASWLVDVVDILTGNFDRAGGMMFPRPATGQAEPVTADPGPVPYGRFRSRVRGFPEFDGQLPAAVMAEEIEEAGDDDRLRALITVAGNPVLTTPNGKRLARALEKLDFMVSVDIYLNETTCHADVILPTTVHLEHENFDFLFQSTSVRNMVRYSPQVFDPLPDAKHHWEVLLELTARLVGTTAEKFDEMVVAGAIATFIGRPGTPCEHVDPDDVRRKLVDVRGPERMLDLLLRAGPYGDRFEDDGEGLSLAKLRGKLHALDLGPLEPRLPEILRTSDRRIQLAPDLLVGDVDRLLGTLEERGRDNRLVLIGRRQLRNMNSWLHNLPELMSGGDRCTLVVNPEDARRSGIANGGRARVRSRTGEVAVAVEVSDEMMPGVVSLPHGFGHGASGTRLSVANEHAGVSYNDMADENVLDALSGNAVLNGIPVEVFPA